MRPHDVPAPTGLAPVLSHLQRASKLSLRILGERASLSASHLSRILSGERFPDWPVTARIARACGADPCALRKVGEDAETHRADKRHKEHTLDSALRYLHHRAGAPTTWSMAVASSGTLDQDEINAILDGATVPDWDIVRRLVLVVDGEPTYFEPPRGVPPRRVAPPHTSKSCSAYSSALSSTAPSSPPRPAPPTPHPAHRLPCCASTRRPPPSRHSLTEATPCPRKPTNEERRDLRGRPERHPHVRAATSDRTQGFGFRTVGSQFRACPIGRRNVS
ncbi:helix-turn-helix domain-containing protein [Streptomyces sp. NPDC058989]|uniref:helix-turn-helix domain-containing protein n=1 Tax=Streptomyces sp. NPDC058989 TaxID=3346686 RepID=UPI0036A0C70D